MVIYARILTALPVSSTHSIIGSILGFGLIAIGPGVVNRLVLGVVVLSLVISFLCRCHLFCRLFPHPPFHLIFIPDPVLFPSA